MTAGPGPDPGFEESPDSRWQGCRVTPGGGNPRESATEKRQPLFTGVTVKRWGKSPPRTWQQGRHGKPHPEQCQIGASRGGWSRISVRDTARRDANAREARVGSLTAVATRLAEEWSSKGASPGQNPAYRLSAQINEDRGWGGIS